MTRTSFRDELVHVSALQEYVYCPRRYYYQRYHDQIDTTYELADGRSKHTAQSRRGGWTTERYFRSDEIGLHAVAFRVDKAREKLTSRGVAGSG